MRESRCMSLLPRTTLHSDSEHVLVCRLPTEYRTRLVVRIFHRFLFVLIFVHVFQYLNLAIARLYSILESDS
jgi:hypothetical protein